jgi:hypothetical protein
VLRKPHREIEPKTLVSAAARTIVRKQTVEYASLIPWLQSVLGDPVRRPFVRLNGMGSSAGSGEFWHSQFCHEPLLYVRNLCFYSGGVRFCVGDVAQLQNKQCVRVEALEYGSADFSADGSGIPPLRVCVTRFGSAAAVKLPVGFPPKPGELVHWPERTSTLDPGQFVRRVLCGSGHGSEVVCRFAVVAVPGKPADEVCCRPFVRSVPLMTFEAAAYGKPFVWVSIFIDSFTAPNSRSHSITGVYAVLSSMTLEQQHRCVHTCMLIPPNVDLGEVISFADHGLLFLSPSFSLKLRSLTNPAAVACFLAGSGAASRGHANVAAGRSYPRSACTRHA